MSTSTKKTTYYGRKIGDKIKVGVHGLRFARIGSLIDAGHEFTIVGIQRNMGGGSRWKFVYVGEDSENRTAYLFPNEVY